MECCIQSYSIISNDSGCNSQKLGSSGDTNIQVRVHQSIEIDVCVGCASTLTEEHGMAGSSVKTLVERRYPPGHNFTLSTGETFVMFKQRVHYFPRWEILNLLELNMKPHFIWHQNHATHGIRLSRPFRRVGYGRHECKLLDRCFGSLAGWLARPGCR
jgi:hypothetical protein